MNQPPPQTKKHKLVVEPPQIIQQKNTLVSNWQHRLSRMFRAYKTHQKKRQNKQNTLQGGHLPVTNGVITSVSTVLTCSNPSYPLIFGHLWGYRGYPCRSIYIYIYLYNNRLGAHLAPYDMMKSVFSLIP